ncbi:MAG: alpha/beta fold hydrolase [Rhodobacteraceae bacterium]|nr:alpha/beta fold hydrolase [Paracoccaceae bacterium]
MTDFLLVHGACHGAWCWRDTIPALAALGHKARAIDLPGHGDDKTPLAEVTLDRYRDAVLAAAGPETVVVGHSMAGFPISAAAEARPDGLRGLIYLCAYAPRPGMSLIDMRRAAPRQPLLPAVVPSPDRTSFTVDPEQAEAVFYHDCPPEAVAFAIPRLCPQAVAPQAVPVALGAAYASVPRAYIRCAFDQTIPPEYQSTMTEDWPAGSVHHMPTSHSPFFADPQGLARMLADIARGF